MFSAKNPHLLLCIGVGRGLERLGAPARAQARAQARTSSIESVPSSAESVPSNTESVPSSQESVPSSKDSVASRTAVGRAKQRSGRAAGSPARLKTYVCARARAMRVAGSGVIIAFV